MKKKIFLGIIFALMSLALAFTLASCGGKACEHRYQGVVSQERTCETDEVIIYTCALCQHTYSMTTPAMGHDLVNHSGKTPTCTQVGWDAYVTCSRCDYTTYEKLPPHTMENGECIVCHTPESTPGLEYQFNSDSKSYTVTGIGTCTESDIVIGIYKGYSITSIDFHAFFFCDNLTSVVIPDSVTGIYEGAFSHCRSLTSITVDGNNSAYKSIDGNLYTKDEKTLIQYAIGKKDTEFKVPNGVTSIGDYAFMSCESLTSIVIPDSVTSIGDGAFGYCASLTSIVIPDSVTIIGISVFSDCAGLTIYCEATSKPSGWHSDWNWSDRPVVWGYNNITTNSEYDYVLHNDKAHLTKYKGDATEVIIPSSIDGYEVEFFGSIFSENESITSVEIPNSVTSIGHYAFYHCTNLTNVTIGNGVTSIGGDVFSYCKSLTSIVIPDSVTSIGHYTFYRCTSLTSVTIGNGVTSIGNAAFYYCDSLTSVRIGNSVTSIGGYAFYDCYSLMSIVIPDSVTSISEYAFYHCDNLTIYCEATSKPSGWDSYWNYYPKRPVVWGYKAD